jgi:hypothetical protein
LGSESVQELQTRGIKFFARFSLVDDSAWKVLVRQQEGEDILTVVDDRTSKLLLSTPGNSERFLSAEAVQVETRSDPFLVTRWTKGAHGQELRIYDPRSSKQPLVYSKASSWAIDYRQNEGRLKIRGKSDEPKNASASASFELAWP